MIPAFIAGKSRKEAKERAEELLAFMLFRILRYAGGSVGSAMCGTVIYSQYDEKAGQLICR